MRWSVITGAVIATCCSSLLRPKMYDASTGKDESSVCIGVEIQVCSSYWRTSIAADRLRITW